MTPDDLTSLFPSCKEAGCPGHIAGYNWAADNNITDEGDCTGKSEDFIEGCQVYVQQNSSSQPPTSSQNKIMDFSQNYRVSSTTPDLLQGKSAKKNKLPSLAMKIAKKVNERPISQKIQSGR